MYVNVQSQYLALLCQSPTHGIAHSPSLLGHWLIADSFDIPQPTLSAAHSTFGLWFHPRCGRCQCWWEVSFRESDDLTPSFSHCYCLQQLLGNMQIRLPCTWPLNFPKVVLNTPPVCQDKQSAKREIFLAPGTNTTSTYKAGYFRQLAWAILLQRWKYPACGG